MIRKTRISNLVIGGVVFLSMWTAGWTQDTSSHRHLSIDRNAWRRALPEIVESPLLRRIIEQQFRQLDRAKTSNSELSPALFQDRSLIEILDDLGEEFGLENPEPIFDAEGNLDFPFQSDPERPEIPSTNRKDTNSKDFKSLLSELGKKFKNQFRRKKNESMDSTAPSNSKDHPNSIPAIETSDRSNGQAKERKSKKKSNNLVSYLKKSLSDKSTLATLAESKTSKKMLNSMLEAMDESSSELFAAYADPNRLQDWSWLQHATKSLNRKYARLNRKMESTSRSLTNYTTGVNVPSMDQVVGAAQDNSVQMTTSWLIVLICALLGVLVFRWKPNLGRIHTENSRPLVDVDLDAVCSPNGFIFAANIELQNRFGKSIQFWNHRRMFRRLANDIAFADLDIADLASTYEFARYADPLFHGESFSSRLRNALRILKIVQERNRELA